ncbi:hypothetical protein PZ895_10005 [Mesorhizobium sp. YIM 152430]|uniref:hypothetical protein n=1 Tax=Mesorhizobium sp. YIM 152430 TaxID=3031761 RepID=UPI0023DC447D|nr:hypothetical protein [Mesorhizobium sp. YIM 152430]MDF1600111.1 hypothetical protein [Mesorhizobium sp. YIM 152430]
MTDFLTKYQIIFLGEGYMGANSQIIAIGAVTAALIAGFFSFLNLVISKEQKISEFRQDWINCLRSEIAQYVASIRFIAGANEIWNNDKTPTASTWQDHWKAMQIPYDNAARAFTSICLRLNPDELNSERVDVNKQFLVKLNEVRNLVRKDQYSEATVAADELNDLARPILKEEWNRVKSGERNYRYSRNGAAILLLLALIAVSILLAKQFGG